MDLFAMQNNNISAPFGRIYFLWHFDVDLLHSFHQGKLIILWEEIADLHCALKTIQREDKRLLSHLWSTVRT